MTRFTLFLTTEQLCLKQPRCFILILASFPSDQHSTLGLPLHMRPREHAHSAGPLPQGYAALSKAYQDAQLWRGVRLRCNHINVSYLPII